MTPTPRRQRALRPPAERPSYRKILEHAISVLNDDGFDRFNVQRVLDEANVSRATLYRHFPDVDGLIEAALIEIFRKEIFINLRLVSELVASSTDFEAFRDGLRRVVSSVSELPPAVRLRRAHIVTLAHTRPAFGSAVASVQQDLTDGWGLALQEIVRRGFARQDLDIPAVAVIVQSIGIGRIIDDAAVTHLSDEQWANAYFEYLDRVVLAHPN